MLIFTVVSAEWLLELLRWNIQSHPQIREVVILVGLQIYTYVLGGDREDPQMSHQNPGSLLHQERLNQISIRNANAVHLSTIKPT